MRTQEVAYRAGSKPTARQHPRSQAGHPLEAERAMRKATLARPRIDTYSAAIEIAATPGYHVPPLGLRGARYSARPAVVVSEKLNVRWCWRWFELDLGGGGGGGTRLSELFPQSTQMLDRFHAQEQLSQVGKIIRDSPEGNP